MILHANTAVLVILLLAAVGLAIGSTESSPEDSDASLLVDSYEILLETNSTASTPTTDATQITGNVSSICPNDEEEIIDVSTIKLMKCRSFCARARVVGKILTS